MDILRGPAAENEIKGLLRKEPGIKIAVAYWGEGAVERLGFRALAEKKVQVVCNLRSGGCDPAEINALIELFGPDAVLTNDKLHAKVWWTERVAVVGSSNASTNGYGLEGDEAAGLIEMNVRVTAPADLLELERWYNHDLAAETRRMTRSDFLIAKKRRAQIRAGRPLSGASLLEVAKHDPQALRDRNILVWVWKHTERSNWANDKLKHEQSSRYDSEIDCYENVHGACVVPGSYILDFNLSSGASPVFGAWQVLLEKPLVKEKVRGLTNNILLCRYVNSVAGLKLGPRKSWNDAAKRAASSSKDEWALSEFAALYMQQ